MVDRKIVLKGVVRMAFFQCPKCKSENVKNFPLNTENGYPTDATYQGCCMDCGFEEPYKFNKEGNFYYID